jgi:hypothetical protein
MNERLTNEEVEGLWHTLSEAIDTAGEAHQEVFLTKLVLLLAQALGDYQQVLQLLQIAEQDL